MVSVRCRVCDHADFEKQDGFFNCLSCGTLVEDIVDTATSEENFIRGRPGSYSHSTSRRSHVASSSDQHYTFNVTEQPHQAHENQSSRPVLGGESEASMPSSTSALEYEDYHTAVRMRYLLGLQKMLTMQLQTLVEKYSVTPLILGVAGSLWLRFVAASNVLDDRWADEAILESEIQKPADMNKKSENVTHSSKYASEPHNLHGQRAVLIWFRALRDKIPLSTPLNICFLTCHVVREAVLPTDIVEWCAEGSLPYINAFIEIEKHIGKPSKVCPLTSEYMFRPSHIVKLQNLEPSAAAIAGAIGLHLPPVNFYAIARRYLKSLALPMDKILPQALRVFEWSTPPELWLSGDDKKLPTRVCVMSIIIVAIRIQYKLHGFGYWENSLAKKSSKNSSNMKKPDDDNDVEQLLENLEALYHKLHLNDIPEYANDLDSYLKYCKEVVFVEQEPSHLDYEEERLMDQFWKYYNQHKDADSSESSKKRYRGDFNQSTNSDDDEKCKHKGKKKVVDNDQEIKQSGGSGDYAALMIKQMKLNMEDNKFDYIPPRVKPKILEYLHYVRKRDDVGYHYAAHADYYILLRACAKVAGVDARIMHDGALALERRLAWLENRIQHCLHLRPNFTCQHCSNTSNATDVNAAETSNLEDMIIADSQSDADTSNLEDTVIPDSQSP